MRDYRSVLLTASALGFGVAPALAEVDFSDPAAVVDAIFVAAKSGDDADLASLCDPQGENDGDTREYICEMTADSGGWGEFVEYFSEGSVAGDAVIDGDEAAVPILFGPGGKRDETMNLIRRNGGWYLMSFLARRALPQQRSTTKNRTGAVMYYIS